MKKQPGWSLASISPFDALPIEEVGVVEQCSFEKHFQRGNRIFVEGSAARTVWIVKEGRVHLEKGHSNGKVSTMCVRAQRDLLCCLPALDREDYPATAIAKELSTLIGIPSEVFSELMAQHPDLSRRVVAMLCQCMRHMEETAWSRAYESAKRRVVNVLLMMEKKFGPEIPLTRQELAELSGLTVETVIRITSRLKKKKLLSSNGKNSLRVDAEKLRAHLGSS